ncbi:MAG: hypothetical protein HN919_06635, partial [Verrucomicrobia bacterium]|nr:hypothetical protein [Verrucomicrobiota bacterium]
MSRHFEAASGIRTTTYPFLESPEVITEISATDKEVLRLLAARKMEIAAHPQNLERKDLWYRHNNLEGSRPMVLAQIQDC